VRPPLSSRQQLGAHELFISELMSNEGRSLLNQTDISFPAVDMAVFRATAFPQASFVGAVEQLA